MKLSTEIEKICQEKKKILFTKRQWEFSEAIYPLFIDHTIGIVFFRLFIYLLIEFFQINLNVMFSLMIKGI